MLGDWARFAGFFAFAMFALVGSLLWALNYPPQDAEWTCETQQTSRQPNQDSKNILSCRRSQPKELHNAASAGNQSSTPNANDEPKITDKLLVLFTLMLVGVGAFQAFYLWGTVKATAVAANAADLSARAAIAIQLPIIRVVPDGLAHAEGQIEDCYVHAVTISNLGDTKAFPKEVIYGWTVGETLPQEPRYQISTKFPHNCILEPGKINFIQNLDGSFPLKDGQWTRISAGNYLWFYCAIIYEDFMGETRSHGFCWRWSNTGIGLGWRVEKADAYNKKNAALSEPPQYS
jgi:hypothetical protein